MNLARTRRIILAAAACLVPAVLLGQTPQFAPLMPTNRVSAAVAVDGRIYAGLAKGGVVEFDPLTEQVLRHLDRASGLGGHYVQSMTWSGTRLVIGCRDGGITAISDPGTQAEFIQLYRDGLSSLDVTCVTGQRVGTAERIYYGTDGEGIGVIEGGREGAYYTTLDGLLDDHVNEVALSGELLLIAMPSGWSRFIDNVFTSWDYATTGMDTILDLEVAADGAIWAATSGGVKRWDAGGEAWVDVHGTERYIDLARDGDAMLALRSADLLVRIDGAGVGVAVPQAPAGQARNISVVVPSADGVWLGGDLFRTDQGAGSRAAAAWLGRAGDAAAPLLALPGCRLGVHGGFDGAAVAADNSAWVGDREGDGLAGWDGNQWYNVDRRATVANDSTGLFNFGGSILAMTRSGADLYFNQYTTGLARFRPAAEPGGAEQWDLMTPYNSPLEIDGIIALAGHPDGGVFVCSDAANWWGGSDNALLGVDVLFDPEHPYAEASWLHLSTADLGGNVILAAYAERRDIVWFSVQGVGLRRWDINGLLAGPDDVLTWRDPSDDSWSASLLDAGGGNVDFTAVNAITVGPDGTIWAGGSGLARFLYSPSLDLVTFRGEWQRKADTFTPGLLGQVVRGLAFDRNADLWILTDGGLNRFQIDGDALTVDAYTDLVTFGGLDQRFYSATAIAPLPGGTYRDLGMAADGTRLVLTSDLGGVMLDIPRGSSGGGDVVDQSYLYPNPFPGDQAAAALNLGGLTVDEDNPVVFEVLNLTGQIVYRNSRLASSTDVWDGRTRLGDRVASGLYVVKITQAGVTRVRTLAVAF
ncbi:MAG: T9SS type A sorting domain-containing protein [Candidatus Krumholzibacteriia bacterium]